MDRARAKLGDKVTIPAVVEEIEYTTLGEINYKVVPLNTWFDADEIEALGQTESEDCISRKQAVEALTGWDTEPLDEDIVRTLNNLPPVTPTERTGEWVEHDPKTKRLAKIYECPFCGDEVIGEKTNFCPNCGAKMVDGGDV